MNVHVPDCYLVDDLLIFGDITRGVICQGIDVSMPDQTNVEADVLSALEGDLRTFLANLQEGSRDEWRLSGGPGAACCELQKSRSCLWRWCGPSIEAECLKGRLTSRIRPPT